MKYKQLPEPITSHNHRIPSGHFRIEIYPDIGFQEIGISIANHTTNRHTMYSVLSVQEIDSMIDALTKAKELGE